MTILNIPCACGCLRPRRNNSKYATDRCADHVAKKLYKARHGKEPDRRYTISKSEKVKGVKLIYPGEVVDRMSVTEFKRWHPSDFAPGTVVQTEGKTWTI